jgi:hypothetical protein
LTVTNGSVEACVDFLRYCTTPENNARLVNSLSATTPAVVGAEAIPLFKPLNDIAAEDMEAGFKDWHASQISGAFDSEFSDLFLNLTNGYLLGEITLEQYQDQYDEGARAAIRRMERNVNWDKSRW